MLARSFERIHRSNLIGMGILPLMLPEDWHPSQLDIVPGDTVEIGLDRVALAPHAAVPIVLRRARSGAARAGIATALLQTVQEAALIRAGGMVPMILKRALARSRSAG